MLCRTCGSESAEGVSFCAKCGSSAESFSGDTRPIFNPGATRIFQEKDLSKTVVFTPQRKSIYGWLVVIDGPDAWLDYKIAVDDIQLFLGSGEECQVKIHDDQLTKMHASIRLTDGKITITDLDTLSGTSVNGQPITKSDLQDGDTVTVGASTLKFRKL